MPGNNRRVLPWRAGVLILLLLTLAGCVDVQVVDTTPAAVQPDTFTSPLPPAGADRDLAVLAVDFDPPLDYQTLIVRRQPVALLVAIENAGRATERGVIVHARLSTAEDPALVLSERAGAESIAPGEMVVVRFPALKDVPYHLSYRLEVLVDPLPGEENLDNNQKTFEIQIQRRPNAP